VARPSAHDNPLSPAQLARRRLVSAACLLAQFMAAVESTIVATAMPTIVGDLGGFHLFSWVFAAYLLAQAASTPVYGRLADLYGRKRVFQAGTALFLAGSLACGFAWGMVPLIVFRTLQGLGAGAIQPIAWTVIGDLYAPAERARMQGWLSSVFGASAITGPAIGALIVERLHWSLVFWINLPIGILTATMLGILLEEKLAPARRRVDASGAVLLMIGIGALLAALVEAESLGAGTIAVLVALGATALGAFVVIERRVVEPIVPYRLWRRPIIAIGNFGSLAIGVVMMCNNAYLPAYVQGAMGRSPMVAGFTLGASSVLWSLGTVLSARLMIRTSYRATGIAGSVIMMMGAAVLLALEPSRGPLWAAAGAATLGLGMGFCNTTFVVAVQTAVGWAERGAATSANLFMRTIGQSLGAAFFGMVLALGVIHRVPGAGDAVDRLLRPGARAGLGATASRLADAFAAAMHDAYLILGLLVFVVLAFTWRIPARLSPTRPAAAGTERSLAGADN
jgi:EmrB/QacA subfamily drug resistance transporter